MVIVMLNVVLNAIILSVFILNVIVLNSKAPHLNMFQPLLLQSYMNSSGAFMLFYFVVLEELFRGTFVIFEFELSRTFSNVFPTLFVGPILAKNEQMKSKNTK